MIYSSNLFLLYFLPFFFVAYFIAPIKWRNTIALLGSILFYSWGAPRFVFVLLCSALLDHWIGTQMVRPENESSRKKLLIFGLIVNLSTLAFFKYCNFFVDNFSSILAVFDIDLPDFAKVALPIGISFFTFQKISFLVDVYRRQSKPFERVQDYLLYVTFFPQLIAGPIIRFCEISDQIIHRRHEIDDRLLGLFRFSIGLAKKVWIADILAIETNRIFAEGYELTTGEAWLGIITYSFRIYFDFSGYSDMAIGLGKMMGFRFPENFDFPFTSTSIREFWQRWHMTLTRWMKDYLYIPLGGNQSGSVFLNLWVVFLLSGLWHGDSWNFVLWGAYHGFFLVLARKFNLSKYPWYKVPGILFTFIIVCFGWVLFATSSLSHASSYLQQLFSDELTLPLFPNGLFWTMLLLAVVSSLFRFIPILNRAESLYENQPKTYGRIVFIVFTTLILLIISIGEIAAVGFNPFIYFRF